MADDPSGNGAGFPRTAADGLRLRAEGAFTRLLSGASGVLVAVSGGPDSMALLALLSDWARHKAPALRVTVATVDHGLRADSAAEARLVAAHSQTLGLPHATLPWMGEKPASGLQDAARNARYRLLAEHAVALGLSHITTAHHADDQAETVLMRLVAGSGITGLAAMRPSVQRQGITLVRPLLPESRAALARHCVDAGLPFVTDPANADPRFGRTRTRRLLTALAQEGLTVERLARLAVRAGRAEDALEAQALACLGRAGLGATACVVRTDWRLVADQPVEIRLRVLAGVLHKAGETAASPRLDALEVLLEAIDHAHGRKARLRRTLAGRMVTLMAGGVLSVTVAPPRRRA